MQDTKHLTILYEDPSCTVVEKPQELPSEDTGELCLPSLLRHHFARQGEDTEVYPVHRLDKPTGGAILYAKNKESAAFYSAAVAERRLGKRYLAVVIGTPDAEADTLCDLLYHDKRQNKVFVVKRERKGAKEAILRYRVLETAVREGATLSLLEIELVTGRTHQIRAQFASRKLPVYGDRRYGSKESLSGGRIALWSHSLSFPLANGKTQTVLSVPPKEFPWSLFSEPKTL